jgi:hypothetical protein
MPLQPKGPKPFALTSLNARSRKIAKRKCLKIKEAKEDAGKEESD